MRDRYRLLVLVLLLVLAGCTLPPLQTPTPSLARAGDTPGPAPTGTPSPRPTPTAEPTPDLAAVPGFATGEIVATTTDGLRIRRLPGADRHVVVERLPTGAEVTVIMGPVQADDLGWYLVADADPDDPALDDGWIAARYEPDPFLVPSDREPNTERYVAGFAHRGDAEFGPVTIEDAAYGIRWLAVDPEGIECSFQVFLATTATEPIPVIKATPGNAPIPGEEFSNLFTVSPNLRGPVFVTVSSDCAWALAFVRFQPEPTPSPG